MHGELNTVCVGAQQYPMAGLHTMLALLLICIPAKISDVKGKKLQQLNVHATSSLCALYYCMYILYIKEQLEVMGF